MLLSAAFQLWQSAFSAKILFRKKYSVIYLVHDSYWILLFSMDEEDYLIAVIKMFS